MPGTILIKGANGLLAGVVVQRILKEELTLTLLLTVGNTSSADPNTKKLRDLASQYPASQASIRGPDLSNLKSVHNFADIVAAEISAEQLSPLISI